MPGSCQPPISEPVWVKLGSPFGQNITGLKGHNEFTDAQRARGHNKSRVARNFGWNLTPPGNTEVFLLGSIVQCSKAGKKERTARGEGNGVVNNSS